jgi:hypothetical protein
MNVPTAGQKRFVIVAATGMVGGYTLRYALEHPAVGRVTVIGRRKVGAGNMPAAEKIGGDHSARAKIIRQLNPPGASPARSCEMSSSRRSILVCRRFLLSNMTQPA